MSEIHNRKALEPFRKRLRNNLTPAEATLWKYLKGGQTGKNLEGSIALAITYLIFIVQQNA